MTALSASAGPTYTQKVEIEAPPVKVWEYLVTPDLVNSYYLAPLKTLDLREDGEIAYGTKDETMISGKVKQVSTNETFAHTFRFSHVPSDDESEPETLVTYTIETKDGPTVLTFTHSGFPNENQTFADISGGWPIILERLKEAIEAEQSVGGDSVTRAEDGASPGTPQP